MPQSLNSSQSLLVKTEARVSQENFKKRESFIKYYLTCRPKASKMPMELLEYAFQKLQTANQRKDKKENQHFTTTGSPEVLSTKPLIQSYSVL